MGLAQTLTLSYNSASILICYAVNALLNKIRLNIPARNIVACCLNKNCLSAMIDEEACKILAIIR